MHPHHGHHAHASGMPQLNTGGSIGGNVPGGGDMIGSIGGMHSGGSGTSSHILISSY